MIVSHHVRAIIGTMEFVFPDHADLDASIDAEPSETDILTNSKPV